MTTDGEVEGTREGGFEKLKDDIWLLGGVQIRNNYLSPGKLFKCVFVWDLACIGIYIRSDGSFLFSWCSNDPVLTSKFCELEKTFAPPIPQGAVYVLVPSPSGLALESIGIGAVPVEKDNYRPEAMAGFDRVVKDLQEPDPLGRLAIFDGPPGTGKTYLIRALLSSLPKVKFLILPSNMADSLTGPQLLGTLIGNKPSDGSTKKTETTVLVIEDADRCLSKRGSDNISAISSILNMSDGIIGNLLDLRIICTTNAKVDDIDEAILRTGRLSARVEVGLLESEQAKAIYARVGGTAPQAWNKKFYALSDVYAMAKGMDSEEVGSGTPKRKIGF